jgi:hypothetical protein
LNGLFNWYSYGETKSKRKKTKMNYLNVNYTKLKLVSAYSLILLAGVGIALTLGILILVYIFPNADVETTILELSQLWTIGYVILIFEALLNPSWQKEKNRSLLRMLITGMIIPAELTIKLCKFFIFLGKTRVSKLIT